MAATKPKKYMVAPATGRLNAPKKDRWNVVVARTRQVMRGPYHSEALAQLICDAMNEAHEAAR